MRRKIIISTVLALQLLAAAMLCGCAYNFDYNVNLDGAGTADVQNDTSDVLEETPAAVVDETSETADLQDDAAKEDISDTEADIEEDDILDTPSEESEQKQTLNCIADTHNFILSMDREGMFELAKSMGAGFNLGNSLDSTGNKSINAETHWGNPKTTPEMIKAIINEGFGTIRIPVSWGDHTGPAPDYKIDDDWMDRVQEVVDYAYNERVFVIINTHHEEDTWLNTDPANKDAVKAQLVATWMQIAERFKDYDHGLLFEGMNEPRLKGSAKEWSGGTKEERDVVNELNQAFIDTVRASGGNNATRPLIICPYATSADVSALRDLVIPDDPNIIVAVHAYTPYGFTYEDPNFPNYPEWNSVKKMEIEGVFNGINKNIIERGAPVILDEFGAQNKNNRADIDAWLEDFLSVANKYNIKCVWWDNGNYSGSGEKFAIFNRKDCTWYAESTADILVIRQYD